MVHVGWTFEMSPDMQAEKIFRGKGSFNIRDAGTSIEWRDNNAPYLGLSESYSSPFFVLIYPIPCKYVVICMLLSVLPIGCALFHDWIELL